ncbi:MAG: STAS domain-containing protein [Coriobacteriales bacterium]|nr:STAS domain-containing protein [Coriobacteriales bacterium]
MELDVTVTLDPQETFVYVTGEVDVSNADVLRNGIDDAFGVPQVRSVGVDLSEVPYIDSTGIGVLVGAKHKADELGCEFKVIKPQDNVARIMSLLGVDAIVLHDAPEK